jgi:hypothetical protein
MPEQFASKLINFFPGEFALKVREGFIDWSTLSVPGTVETIIPYTALDGTIQIFACTNQGIFDVTSRTDISDPAVFPLTEGRCNYVQITNTGGTYLIICNGTDDLIQYDGTTFQSYIYTPAPTAPNEIGGIQPNDVVAVTTHNKRLWFLEKDSMTAYYLPLEQVGGLAEPFYLGSVFKRGGKLLSVFTMSTDSGEGLDDVLIFQTTQGELAGYMGGNVEDFEEWHLSAVHYVSKARTSRGYAQTTGDVHLLTSYGVLSLQSIITRPDISLTVSDALSKNIYPSLQAEFNARGDNVNWEIVVVPTKQMLMVCFPPGARPAVQFVMNTETNAWTQYNLPIFCTGLVDGVLFFGTNDGRVCRFGDVFTDNVSYDGTSFDNVEAVMEQAYNYFGQRGVNKHFKMVKLIWVSTYEPRYCVNISTDFRRNTDFDTCPYPPQQGVFSLWGLAIWGQSLWSNGLSVLFRWDGLARLGYCASLMVKVTTDQPLELDSTDWAYEPGLSL